MKNSIINFLILFTLLVLPKIALSQSDEIEIKFIGNCGLYFSDGDLDIYVDFPYKSGFFNYMEYDDSEIDSIKQNAVFIFTHKHPDHYSSKKMRKTLKKKKGHKYGKWNLKELQEFSDTTANFTIQPIETEHSLSSKHFSYLITWHDKRIYISGDEESTENVLSINDLDWAFVPYWLAEKMMEQNAEIDAFMVGIYHFYPTTNVTNSRPEKYKIVNKQGEIFTIPY